MPPCWHLRSRKRELGHRVMPIKVMIDTRRLLIQWGVILVATGIGLFAFSRQTRRREEKKMEEESEDDTRH